MKFELKTPVCLINDFSHHPNAMTAGDAADMQPYMLGSSEDLTDMVVNGLEKMVSKGRVFADDECRKMLNGILETRAFSSKDSFAFLYFSKVGVLVASMGKCRIIQVRLCADESIVYDSANQIVDIYSSKAAVELLTDVEDGDVFVLCSSGKFDVKSLNKFIAAGDFASDGACFHDSKGNAVDLMIMQVGKVSGRASKIMDLNAKWYALFALLAIGIVALALSTFTTSKVGESATPSEADSVSAVSGDTIVEPAVEVGPEPVRPDTASVVTDTLHHNLQKKEVDGMDEENPDVDIEEKPAQETPAEEPVQEPEVTPDQP